MSEETTTIHHILGALTLAVVLIIVALDLLPDYDADPILVGLLVASYTVLLGFGVLLRKIIEAKYE